MTHQTPDEIRDQLLHAIDHAYTTGVLGYGSPEELLAAYDTSRTPPADQTDPELTAEEARTLADELGLQLYRAQDAIAFVAECCDIADREQRTVTTADVREWLKGARCGRQLAADAELRRMADETATETPDAHATHPCNAATMHRLGDLATAHGPHLWVMQPGMDPVRCPGTRKPPMDPVHILGIWADDEPAAGARQDEPPQPSLRDRHRAAWRALTPDQQTARIAELDQPHVDETAPEPPSPSCAHCGQRISRVTGTLTTWWVHDPGGNTVCHPERAASSPRATPKPVDETAATESRPCRTFVSGGAVWCCEEGEADCPCVCHHTAAGARQDGAESCAECGDPKTTHREGDDPVSPGYCTACPDDDAWHDYRPAHQDGTES